MNAAMWGLIQPFLDEVRLVFGSPRRFGEEYDRARREAAGRSPTGHFLLDDTDEDRSRFTIARRRFALWSAAWGLLLPACSGAAVVAWITRSPLGVTTRIGFSLPAALAAYLLMLIAGMTIQRRLVETLPFVARWFGARSPRRQRARSLDRPGQLVRRRR